MSFPTASQLENTPLLPAWLIGRMWFESGEYSGIYHDDVTVESIRFGKANEDDETVFMVRSREGRQRIFNTRLVLFEEYDRRTRRTTLDQITIKKARPFNGKSSCKVVLADLWVSLLSDRLPRIAPKITSISLSPND